MDDAFVSLIVVLVIGGLIVAAIVALIGLILTTGVFVVAAIAGTGTVCGLGVGVKNFADVIREAHEKVSR